MTNSDNRFPKMALMIAVTLWASAFVGIRAGLQGYSPGSLALLRFMIASICMGIIYWRKPKREVFARKDLVLLFIFGAVGFGFYNIFLNYGELSVSSGISSFIISQSPLLTLLFSVLFLGERFNILTLVGMLVSIGGVGLIAFGESHTIALDHGIIYVFLAMIISGFYSTAQKPFLKKYHAIDVTVFIIWGGTIFLLIYLPELFRDIQTAPLSATLAVIYLGIFPAAIASLAWSYALSAIPASRCVTYLYFMPVIATFLGWLLLGEIPLALSFVGGAIALVGVWIASKSAAQ